MMNALREVRVDRLNEKGVFVAEQILNILHNTVDEKKKGWIFRSQAHFIPYTFEIAHVAGVLRFFIGAPDEYISFFEKQIYAHFPNVEISKVDEFLPQGPAYVSSAELIKDYSHPIKIYTEFKDRSEKETVDPLSSITSALSQVSKSEPLVLQIGFSPLLDREWKSPRHIEILSSKRPKWLKKVLLSRYGWTVQILLSPLWLVTRLGQLLFPGDTPPTEPSK